MKSLMQTGKELVVGITIAFLVPVTVYLGLQVVLPNPGYKNFEIEVMSEEMLKDQAAQEVYQARVQANEEARKEHEYKVSRYRMVSFYLFLLTGIAAFAAGTMLPVEDLSFGLITAGVMHIFISWCHLPASPLVNFIIFALVLGLIVTLALRKKSSPRSYRKAVKK